MFLIMFDIKFNTNPFYKGYQENSTGIFSAGASVVSVGAGSAKSNREGLLFNFKFIVEFVSIFIL